MIFVPTAARRAFTVRASPPAYAVWPYEDLEDDEPEDQGRDALAYAIRTLPGYKGEEEILEGRALFGSPSWERASARAPAPFVLFAF